MGDEQIDHIMPTQGFNIKKLQQNGFDATLWDLGGQKAIRRYWRNYYENSNAIIFVIDSSDKRRVEEAGIELHELLKDTKLSKVPLCVLANKQDLAHALSVKVLSEHLLLSKVRNRAWSIQPCSAKSGNGLKEGLMWTMQSVKDNEKKK